MDEISKIVDDHKRAFAFGFRHLFQKQSLMNAADVAAAAKVHPSAITYIMRGYENRFPSRKAQGHIARVFLTTVNRIVSIGKKIQIDQSRNNIEQASPKHSDPEIQNFLDYFNLDDLNLGDLSTYEKTIIRICKSFENDKEYLQELFDMAGDLFVSYHAEKIERIKKKRLGLLSPHQTRD